MRPRLDMNMGRMYPERSRRVTPRLASLARGKWNHQHVKMHWWFHLVMGTATPHESVTKAQKRFFCALCVFLLRLCGVGSCDPAFAGQPAEIVVPADLGYVIETHPAASPEAPLLIHIQEAHTNLEGQRHLVGILERLIVQQHLKLILVEGGSGDVSLTYLRDFSSPEHRKEVAEKYLQLGILSGEEYLNVVSDEPLPLWGVERNDLYQRNVQAFMEVDLLRAEAQPILAGLRQAIEALKPAVFDPELIELQAKRAAFEQEQLGLAGYAEFLDGLAARHAVAKETFPNLARFLEVHRLEPAIQLDQVQQEQRACLARLGVRMERAAFEALMAKAPKAAEGKPLDSARGKRAPNAAEFYAALAQQAAATGLDLQPYPSLSRYLRYVTQSAGINPSALSDELEQLAGRVRAQLSAAPESRQLSDIDVQVDLVQKLADLALAPDEYARFQALTSNPERGEAESKDDGMCAGWARGLNDLQARHNLARSAFERLTFLQGMLPTVQRFYTAANDRDQALIDNTLAKLRRSGERVAVLITGGFHAPRITELLKAEGVGVAVVAPKVTQATDEQLYRAVLKYKSGRGAFEEVEAAAGKRNILTFESPITKSQTPNKLQ